MQFWGGGPCGRRDMGGDPYTIRNWTQTQKPYHFGVTPAHERAPPEPGMTFELWSTKATIASAKRTPSSQKCQPFDEKVIINYIKSNSHVGAAHTEDSKNQTFH